MIGEVEIDQGFHEVDCYHCPVETVYKYVNETHTQCMGVCTQSLNYAIKCDCLHFNDSITNVVVRQYCNLIFVEISVQKYFHSH